MVIDKKFLEELIVYFPFKRHGPHRQSFQKCFNAAVTSLPSYYLVTADLQIRASNIYSSIAIVYCRGNVYTVPLSVKGKMDTNIYTLRVEAG
jgi:hypothetical protein